MTLIAPTDEAELNRALRLSLKLDTAVAIRYPRDNVPTCNFEEEVLPERASRRRANGNSARAEC